MALAGHDYEGITRNFFYFANTTLPANIPFATSDQMRW
jgi:hypothetical protein